MPQPRKIQPDEFYFHMEPRGHREPITFGSCRDACGGDVVHVAMMAAGPDAAKAVVTVVKSILIQRTRPIAVHLLVDHVSTAVLEEIFSTWQVSCLSVSFHLLLDYTAEIAWVRTAHASGPYGLSKLIYERLLLDVDRVIAIDTDLVFDSDIAVLWGLFQSFNQTNIIGAVSQQSDWYHGHVPDVPETLIWPAVGRGINSGVMLLHLERMRLFRWRDYWTRITREQMRTTPVTGLADQDIFNLAMVNDPALIMILPCEWNVQIHSSTLAEACYRGTKPNVLHWNSPQKFNTTLAKNQTFFDIYRRIQTTDGETLRHPPSQCHLPDAPVAVATGSQYPNITDECWDMRIATIRVYRTHLNYGTASQNKRLYECKLSGNLTEAMLLLRTYNMINIFSTSHVLAQHRFFKFVESNRQKFADNGILLPENIGAICSEVPIGADPEDISRSDMTLVTQTSFDRLYLMPRLLRAWSGPISVAVYLLDAELPQLDAMMQSWSEHSNKLCSPLCI